MKAVYTTVVILFAAWLADLIFVLNSARSQMFPGLKINLLLGVMGIIILPILMMIVVPLFEARNRRRQAALTEQKRDEFTVVHNS